MESLKKITDYLDAYLEVATTKDSHWNGLQFEGKKDIQKILFAVDTGIATFERAVEEQSDMIIVHHGFFWKFANPSIKGINRKLLL